jgi:hypothetical protein
MRHGRCVAGLQRVLASLHGLLILFHGCELRFECCDEYAEKVFRHHTSPAFALRILRGAPQNDIAGGTCDSIQDQRLTQFSELVYAV